MLRLLATQPTLRIAASLAFATSTTAQVVVNEFSPADTGTDDREFVELYNAGTTAVDLGGWRLDATTATGTVTLATVPAATALPPGGFWLVAQPFWTGRDQALVAAMPDGATTLELRDAGGNRKDAVTYAAFAGLWPNAAPEAPALFPPFVSSDGHETSWSRLRDGRDVDRNARDFRVARATPGATNDLPAVPGATVNCDGLPPGTPLAGWFGSRNVPTVIAAATRTVAAGALPPSMQIGAPDDRCLEFAPAPDDGASYWLESDFAQAAGFDAYVYFDATALAAPARQAWSIGARGGTGTDYAWPEPPGVGVDDNGNRGLSWTYLRTSAGAVLRLIDHGDGGRSDVLLAAIPIHSSGWRRLSIDCDGTAVEARFGGSPGRSDGTLLLRRAGITAGNLWIGARNEGVSAPVYVDDMRVRPPNLQRALGPAGCPGTCDPGGQDVTTFGEQTVADAEFAVRFGASVAAPRTFDRVGFFTSRLDAGGSPAVVELRESTGTPPRPGALIAGTAPTPLADVSSDAAVPSWWSAPVGLDQRTADFFVLLRTGTAIQHPLAGAVRDPMLTDALVFAPDALPILRGDGQGNWTDDIAPLAIAFGCPLPGRLDLDSNTNAAAGSFLSVRGTGLGAFRPTLAFLNVTTATIDLGPIGAPGCTGRIALDPPPVSALRVGNADGRSDWLVLIPAHPIFAGLQVHLQWLGFDASANPLGIALSRRLSVTIQ
ncbi:MAG: lamin tail domain-containing protein [Planctomycetota bacterium]